MKKLFACLTVASIVVLALTGALAVIPHSHGDDFNHSKHETCPIHQFGLYDFTATVAFVQLLSLILLVTYFTTAGQSSVASVFHRYVRLRAPPAIS